LKSASEEENDGTDRDGPSSTKVFSGGTGKTSTKEGSSGEQSNYSTTEIVRTVLRVAFG